MPEISGAKQAGMFYWVTRDPTGSRALVEAAGRDFKLTVDFCDYKELAERVRVAPCELVGIELDAEPAQALALVKEIHQRLPHVSIIAASADGSDAMIRGALEAGARD